jgi:hypothetical protein
LARHEEDLVIILLRHGAQRSGENPPPARTPHNPSFTYDSKANPMKSVFDARLHNQTEQDCGCAGRPDQP